MTDRQEQAAETLSIQERFPSLPRVPAINVIDSIQHDRIICLFDGVKRRSLTRYLEREYGMTPADYREYWNLPAEYPMVAPGYREKKRLVAVAEGSRRSRA